MSIIDNSKKLIKDLLSTDKYYIPDYQRPYSWSRDEQATELFEDIMYALVEDKDSHFFGQIVIHEDPLTKQKFIIDGQQRISTVIVLLSALQQIFYECDIPKSKNKGDDISYKYIGRYDDEINELTLFMGVQDEKFFREFIQLRKHDYPKSQKSHELLSDSYSYFYEKIREYSSDDEIEKEYSNVKDIYETVINKLMIICVITNELEEAFIIFETLNSRGKQLETSDLLKNYLFRMASDHLVEVKDNWLKTVDILNGVDITKFLRHYWNSKYDFTREKALFRKIKREIDTKLKCRKFSEEFVKMSLYYKSITNPSEASEFEDQEITELLDKLKYLNTRSFYPIILAMVQKEYSEFDIKQVLKIIEILYVRNCVVSGYVANKYEIDFAKTALFISTEETCEINTVLDRIRKMIVNDEVFKGNFLALTVKVKNAKYILREINDYFEPEVQIKKSNYKIHLEHIMPQMLNNQWLINEKDHTEMLNYLGNLTLLGEEYNKSIKNFSFEKKKEKYTISKINLTKNLESYSQWNKNTIKKRQRELYEKAKEIWGI